MDVWMWSTLVHWEIWFEIILDEFLIFGDSGLDEDLVLWIEDFVEVFSRQSLLLVESWQVAELDCENVEGLELLENTSIDQLDGKDGILLTYTT